ncbi:MAG: hypothetical protein ACRD0X_07750 [Thermoanaerobaculia bacterium]
MRENTIPNLSVHVVWSSQLGAEAHHAREAAELMLGPGVRHYWDPEQRVGVALQDRLGFPAGAELRDRGGRPTAAFDVWLLYAPGVEWAGAAPPEATWWEHQLRVLDRPHPDRRLDPDRFATKAAELAF